MKSYRIYSFQYFNAHRWPRKSEFSMVTEDLEVTSPVI